MPVMKNSRVPDSWVTEAVAKNPFTKLPSGFRTCPGRLAFEYVNKPNDERRGNDGKMMKRDKPQYECSILLPPGAQEQINSILWPEVYGIMKTKWPTRFGANGQPVGLHTPWRDQGERISQKSGQLHNGMTPGLPLMRFTTEYKPQVVGPDMVPLSDEEAARRVYAGVWAVVLFNLFDYSNMTTGVGCGLNGIMVIADDDKLAGGGPDLKAAFGGVQVEARFDAISQFGSAPGAPGMPPPPPSMILPPAQVVGAPPPFASTALPPSSPSGLALPPAGGAPTASHFDLNKMLGLG